MYTNLLNLTEHRDCRTGTAEQGGSGHAPPPTFSVDNKKLPDKIQPACVEFINIGRKQLTSIHI